MSALIGANVSATYTAAELVASGSAFALGDRFSGHDGKEFVFVRASAALSAGDVAIMDASYNASAASQSNDSAGARVAVMAAAIASGSYGWAQVYGVASVRASAAMTAGSAPMVAASGSAGQILNATTGNFAIEGLQVTTGTAGAGTATALLTHPHFGDRVA